MEEDLRVERDESGIETYYFDPYNPLNKQINDEDIQDILKKYGVDVPIFNYELYKRAFIHRSYTKRPDEENKENNIVIMPKPDDCLPLYTKSNERLEFVGDGILECITKYELYRRFPKADEGFMTEKKIALVKNENIGKLAYDMQLHNYYIISKHAEEKKTRTNLKKLGCLFESFIGAIFLDFNKNENENNENEIMEFKTGPGFQFAQIFVENVFETHIDWSKLLKTDDNYKNQLQVKIQKEFKTTPEYVVLDIDEEQKYHMGVYLCLNDTNIHTSDIKTAINYNTIQSFEKIKEDNINLIYFSKASHKIKKKAEQLACQYAIKSIQMND